MAKVIANPQKEQQVNDQQVNTPQVDDQQKPEQGETKPEVKPTVVSKAKIDWLAIAKKVWKITRKALLGGFTVYGIASFITAATGGSTTATYDSDSEE